MSTCHWAFLPTDLLLDVAGRLHDARDLVRFHAVCQPWREAALSSPAAKNTFLPWVISEVANRSLMHSPVFYSGSIPSEANSESEATWSNRERYFGDPLVVWSFSDTAWVARADGEAVWHLDVSPNPTLMNVATGEPIPLPPFPNDDDDSGIERWTRTARGIVYADGTVFLYSIVPEKNWRYPRINYVFTAAILPPGDDAARWTVVEKNLEWPVYQYEDDSCAVYHGGKVLVWVGAHFWCIHTHDLEADGSDTTAVAFDMACDRIDEQRYIYKHSYLFESRGELFWACLFIEHEWLVRNQKAMIHGDFVVPRLVVLVHSLEEDPYGDIDKMRWVERDGQSLGDRVLFLGLPTSLTMDAAKLGVDGGWAYFVYWHRVFRYNLFDGETQPVQWPCCASISQNTHVWLQPQPAIAPIQEIRERIRLHHQDMELKRKKKRSIPII